MDLAAVKDFLASQNQPAFRLKQIVKNYYSGRYSSFDDMTDLSKSLRQQLSEKFALYSVGEDKILHSGETTKARLKLADDKMIETVLMDYGDWLTACISCQVGCPLGCAFCATGKMGFNRNLAAQEIVDQVLYWNHRLYPKYIGRIVYMGMGEPFLNWDNLVESLNILRYDLEIGQRKISISTAGIVPKIIEFADMNTEINLAISLHAPDQATREKIMPVAKQYDFEELKAACHYYVQQTKRQLFFEYVMVKDINDTSTHLAKLITFIKSHPLFFLNLIPLNNVLGGLPPSPPSTISHFESVLTKNFVPYTVRQSLGQSIDSACGQLIISSWNRKEYK